MPDPGEGGKNRKKWQTWTERKVRTAVGIVLTLAAAVSGAGDVAHMIEMICRHL